MVRAPERPRSWWESIDAASWTGLWASWLGWLFDGYETYTLVLVGILAVGALTGLPPAAAPPYFAGLLAITLLGWATGGLIAGVLADYIGRKNVLLYSIIVYAVFALLSAFAQSYWWLLAARFFTGIGLGGEWGAGASLVGEMWPASIRGRVAGIFQSAFGVGFLVSTLVWYAVQPLGPINWRVMFVIGFLPALLTLYVRVRVKNPEIWTAAAREREAALERARRGEALAENQRELVRFTVSRIFTSPDLRSRIWPLLLLSLTTLIGWWGVSTWVPQHAAAVMRAAGAPLPQVTQFATTTALFYNVAGIIGYVSLGFLADGLGRKPTIWLYYLGSLLTTPLFFLLAHGQTAILITAFVNGFFTLGQISWLAVYLPELFPTAVRATAISVVFNLTRYIVAITTFYAGYLAIHLGGIDRAATAIGLIYILGLLVTPFAGRETKGQALPA